MPLFAPDLMNMAEMRVADAQALAAAERWDGAYYIAGYAVEFGLKAVIASGVQAGLFPGKPRFAGVWTHDFVELVRAAAIGPILTARRRTTPRFDWNWRTVAAWSEAARYRPTGAVSSPRAKSMIVAVSEAETGVLPWLKTCCTPKT
ncbi:MAG: hypothetical protein AAF684_09140 [Pseudomonadota bacterium]